ncbi:MAG: 30S ribosomal protein S6e [Halobacteria archaeon]|nr:30S ribosomal protein S6e [Halobacteria archaeon]
MADLRVVISDPETGESYQIEASENSFIGYSIGEEIDGSAVGLDGYTLEITGGSDDTGRPLRGDVEGTAVSEVLVSGGTGFNPTRDGERKRVSVRGKQISDAVVQVNAKIVEHGSDDVESLLFGDDDEEDGDEEDEEAEAEE